MRKILLLLCILSITISAKAQLFGKSWKEGSYYGTDGKKYTGFISWEIASPSIFKSKGDYIFFKPDKKADDLKINSIDLRAFTMRVDEETIDSFTVSKNIIFEKASFLKVLIANDIKLYSWVTTYKAPPTMTMSANGWMPDVSTLGRYNTKISYFFGSDPENVTKLDKKNFIEAMSKIMANKPDAVARIKNKKLRYSNMDDLLYFYKYDIMPPAQAPDPFSGSNN
jgi:hypothetical protein